MVIAAGGAVFETFPEPGELGTKTQGICLCAAVGRYYNRAQRMKTRRTSIAGMLLVALIAGPFLCCVLPQAHGATVASPTDYKHDCCSEKSETTHHDTSRNHDCSNCSSMNPLLQVTHERANMVFTHAPVLDVAAFISPVLPSQSLRFAFSDRDTERVPILPDLFHQSCSLVL